ncbi:MAG: helix-turn-helix domain-containing protein [Blastocatellia bacterium]|nr:helix-turn-helix domain-containing protein [Blastocatellia bacterium]
MKGKAHAREVKAQVIAALIAGETTTAVAAKHNLPRKSVSNWKAALTPEQLAEVSRNTGGRLDELVCDHVATVLESLSAQAKAAGDPEYLRKQSAGDLARLHGTMFENTFSMFSMLGKFRP